MYDHPKKDNTIKYETNKRKEKVRKKMMETKKEKGKTYREGILRKRMRHAQKLKLNFLKKNLIPECEYKNSIERRIHSFLKSKHLPFSNILELFKIRFRFSLFSQKMGKYFPISDAMERSITFFAFWKDELLLNINEETVLEVMDFNLKEKAILLKWKDKVYKSVDFVLQPSQRKQQQWNQENQNWNDKFKTKYCMEISGEYFTRNIMLYYDEKLKAWNILTILHPSYKNISNIDGKTKNILIEWKNMKLRNENIVLPRFLVTYYRPIHYGVDYCCWDLASYTSSTNSSSESLRNQLEWWFRTRQPAYHLLRTISWNYVYDNMI